MICLFGGSFNPVHNGHIALVNAALTELNPDKIIIMPAKVQPFKIGAKTMPDDDRLNMLRLAFAQTEKVEVSDFEIKKGDVSYTIETLDYLHKIYPGERIALIVGEDSYEFLGTWHKGDEILKSCDLITTDRPGYEVNLKEKADYYNASFGATTFFLKAKMPDVSSSEIRARMSQNSSISDLLPEAVDRFIGLKETRRKHTEGVRITAIKLAEKYGADVKNAEIAAVYHDLFKSANVENINLMHSKLAAGMMLAHGFTDQDLINAVAFHTTGRPAMSTLEKVVFLADGIEPSRDYPSVDEIRALAEDSLDRAVLKYLERSADWVKIKGEKLDTDTLDALEYYKGVVNDK